MNPVEVKGALERCGAYLSGHFKLSSGRHSDTYIQKQRVFEHPRLTASLADALVAKFSDRGKPTFNVVVSPALGAIVWGGFVAYAAHTRFLFTERDTSGAMVMRRGQTLSRDDRALVVEDVITTGGSASEVIDVVDAAGASVVGVGALVDRSSTPPRFHLEALLRVEAKDWDPADCPRCAAGDALESPGSRDMTTQGG